MTNILICEKTTDPQFKLTSWFASGNIDLAADMEGTETEDAGLLTS